MNSNSNNSIFSNNSTATRACSKTSGTKRVYKWQVCDKTYVLLLFNPLFILTLPPKRVPTNIPKMIPQMMLKIIPNIIQQIITKNNTKNYTTNGTTNWSKIWSEMKSSCHLSPNKKWAAAALPPTFDLETTVPALFISGHILRYHFWYHVCHHFLHYVWYNFEHQFGYHF